MFYIYNLFAFITLIIISTHCFDLGYVYNKNSLSEKQQFELFSTYIKQEDASINIHNATYNGTLPGFIGALNQMIAINPFDIVFVQCTDDIMKMPKFFIESQNKIIWCVNSYNYGDCHHNFVTGNSIVAPLKDTLSSSYLSVISGVENDFDRFWPQRIKNLGIIFGQETLYNETEGKLHNDNITYYKTFLNNYVNDNVQTFASIKEKTQVDLLLDSIGSGEKRRVLFMPNGLSEADIITGSGADPDNQKRLVGDLILHLYSNLSDYKEFMAQFSGLSTTRESVDNDVFIIGIANMLIDVLQKVRTDRVLDLLPFLYYKEYKYPGGGSITLLPNNNLVTTWFMYEFEEKTSGVITSYMRYPIKINLDFEPDEYFDRYYDEKCYLIHPDVAKVKVDVLKILVVTEYSLQLNDKLLREMIHSLIAYFNAFKPIRGKYIEAVSLPIDPDKEYSLGNTIDQINDLAENHTISAVFLYTSVERRIKIVNGIDPSLMVFYLGHVEGDHCDPNCDMINMNYIKLVSLYLRESEETERIYVIGSNEVYGETTSVLLRKYLIENDGYGKSDILYYDLKDDSYAECNSSIAKAKKDCENGCVILITAEDTYSKSLILAIRENELHENENFTIIFFNMNELTAYSYNATNILFITHYYDGYVYNKQASPFLQKYRKDLLEMFSIQMPLTNIMALIYNAFQQWTDSVILSSDEPETYRSYFYHQITEDPAAGPYEIYYNGYAQGLMQMVRIVNPYQCIYEQVIQDYFARQAKVFHNNTLECSFEDLTAKPVQPISQYKIGLIWNINTKTGSKRYEEVQMFVELLNQDGGINGRKLQVVTTKYDDDATKLNDIVKNLCNDTDLLFFIGTTTTAERNAINKTLIDFDKLCFTYAPSPGNVVYKNIIFMNRLPHQHLVYHFYTGVELFQRISIVYDNTSEESTSEALFLQRFAKDQGVPADNVYSIDPSKQSAKELGDKVSVDLDDDDNTSLLFSFLGDAIDDFMRNYTLAAELHPVLIEDYESARVSNYSYFAGHFCESFYFRLFTTTVNLALKKQIETYKGLPDELMNKHGFMFYTALQIMKSAIETTGNLNSTNLRFTMYETEYDTPVGKLKVMPNNYLTHFNRIRQIQANGSTIPEFYFPSPIYPMPYHPVDNDGKYYDVSFGYGEDGLLKEKNVIIIAYFEYIKQRTNAYMNYDIARIAIETANYNGGIKGAEIVTEVYQCPESKMEASGTVLDLYNRGVKIIIGGCDATHRDYLRSIIESLKMVLIYTGFNPGGDCSKYIRYIYNSPAQALIPIGLHMLYNEPNPPFFIYSLHEDVASRIKLLKSVFDSFPAKIVDEVGIPEELENSETNIRESLIKMKKALPNGGSIMVLLRNVYMEKLLEIIVEMLFDSKKFNNYEEMFNYYRFYLIDSSHTHYANGDKLQGIKVYTSYLQTDSRMSQNFFSNFRSLTSKSYSSYVNAVDSVATTFILQVLRDATSLDTEEILKQTYITKVETAIGNIVADASNHFSQYIYFGHIDKNGDVIAEKTITSSWSGDPWRETFNQMTYYRCDWRDLQIERSTVPVYRMLIIASEDPIHRLKSLIYYFSLYAAVSMVNDDEGGINGYYVWPTVTTDHNNASYIAEQIQYYFKEYDIQLYCGGATAEIRRGMQEGAKDIDVILFFPYDYEGRECLSKGIYFGLPYQSYLVLFPWIVKMSQGTIIVLYSNTVYSTIFYEFLKKDFDAYEHYIEFNLDILATQDNITAVVTIIKNLNLGGGLIVSLLEGDAALSLFSAMKANGLNPPNFISVSLTIDDLSIYTIGEDAIGHYYWDTFIRDMSYLFYATIETRIINIFSFLPQINSVAVTAVDQIIVFRDTMKKMNELTGDTEPTAADFHDLLISSEFAVANGDNVKFTNGGSLYTNNYIKYVEGFENGAPVIKIEYRTQKLVPSYPFGCLYHDTEIQRCDWRQNVSKISTFATVKLGLILSTTGEYTDIDVRSINGVFAAVKEIYFDNDPINNTYISIKMFNYQSNLEYLKQNLEEFLTDEDIKVIVGCSSNDCKLYVRSVLEKMEKPPPYFYGRISLGQECSPLLYHTSLVPDQFVNRLFEYFISTSFNTNLYLLTELAYDDYHFDELIEDASSGLYTFIGSFKVSTQQTFTLNIVKEITANMSGGGVIITALTATDLSRFLQLITKIRADPNQFAIVDILLEEEHLDTILPEYRKNLYKLSRYYKDIPTEANEAFKKKILHYTSESEPTAMLESVYGGVMLWYYAAKKCGCFDPDEIRKTIHGLSIDVGSGTMTMTENNYATTPFFVARYTDDGSELETQYFKYETENPSPWSWNIKRSYGLKCSFKNNEIKTQYVVPVKRVLFVSDLTGILSDKTDGLVDAFQLAINEINVNGGVGGYTIKADIMDMQSDIDYCRKSIADYISSEVATIFTFVDPGCTDYLIENDVFTNNRLLMFITKERTLGFCDQNVAVAVEHVSLYEPIAAVIHTRFYLRLLVFYNEPDDEIANYIIDQSAKLSVDIVTYVASPFTNIGVRSTLRKYNNDEENSNLILFFGEQEDFITLMTALSSANTNNQFHVMVMRNVEKIRTLKQYYNTGYEMFGFYEQDYDSKENEEFKTNIYQRINKEKYISDGMVRLYSSVKLWAMAANKLPLDETDSEGNKISSLDFNALRTYLRSLSFNGPSGLTKFGSNQYLSRIGFLSQIQPDGTAKIVYTTETPHLPEAWPFKDGKYVKCDFDDANVDSQKEINTYTVAVVLSLKGSDAETGSRLFHSFAAALDQINEDGGVLNYYITYQLYDANSSDERYIEIIENITQHTTYNYIFAGNLPDTLERIAPMFATSDRGLFFLGRTYGDKCYNKTIIASVPPYELVRLTLRRLLEMSSATYLVYNTNQYVKSFLDQMNEMMENMQITTNGISNIEEGKRCATNIKLALPNGGYIVNMIMGDDDLIQFYNYVLEESLYYPTYTFIDVFIDKNTLKKLDTKLMTGHIFLGTFFEELVDENYNKVKSIPYIGKQFVQNVHIRTGDYYLSTAIEIPYIQALIWKSVVTKANTFDISALNTIYNYQIDVPSYEVRVLENNYVARLEFAGTVQEDGTILIDWHPTTMFEANPYHGHNSTSVGYICDWAEAKKEKVYTDPIIIAFLHERDIGGKTEIYNSLLQDMTVDEINNAGGVLGRTVAAVHYWVVINDAYKTTREILEEGKSNIIVGCLTAECRNEVSRYLELHDYVFLFTGRDDGFTCNENTINAGLTINQKLDPVFNYFSNIGIESIYVVGSYRNSSQTEFHLIEKYAAEINYPVIGSYFFTPFSTDLLNKCVEDMVRLLDTATRVAVINLFVARENELFLSKFLSNSIIRASVTMIIMNYDPLDLSSSTKSLLSGSYVVSSYDESVKNTISGALKYTATATYQNALELAEISENSYSALFAWKASVEYAKTQSSDEWPTADYVKLSFKYTTTDGPSGSVSVKNTNQILKSVYIFRITDSSLSQVYPKQGLQYQVDPKMTYKSENECTFAKERELYQYDSAIQTVSIVLAALTVACSASTLGFVFFFRHSRIIKSASPLFLYYTCVGIMLLSLCSLVFIYEPTNDAICAFRIWFLAIALDLVFSILFCKAWRIHKLFNNKELQRVKVSNGQLMKMIGIILGAQAIYLLIWQLVMPSETVQTFSSGLSSFLKDVYIQECTSNTIFVVIELVAVILLFIWGAKLAWGVRNASAEFNESMSLMSTIVILGILEIPLNYLLSSEPGTLVIIRSFGISLGSFGVLLLQFSSKFIYVYAVERSTTYGSSSLSASKSNKERSKLLRKAASRGAFTVAPDMLKYGGIALCTISFPDKFYDEVTMVSCSTARRKVTTTNMSSARCSGVKS